MKTNNQAKDKKVIKLGNQRFKIINLTEPLREDVEVFPGDPRPKKKIFCSFNKEGCRHNIYMIGDHNFHPHGDAPNHQNVQYGARGYEYWGLDRVFNQACLIDLSASSDIARLNGIKFLRKITGQHILPFLDQIGQSGALIFRTGYDRWLESNRKHLAANIPYLDESAVEMISGFKKLKVIGTDSLTIDKVGSNYAHRKFRDKLIVECLVNLYRIPKRERGRFFLQTSPIAVVGATGGPILAYAYIPLPKKGLKQQ